MVPYTTHTMESSGDRENMSFDADITKGKDELETEATESEAIQELIRMDLAEKEVLRAQMKTSPPDDTKRRASEGIHLSKKDEELLNNRHKQINSFQMDLPPNNDNALSDSEAIQELICIDLALKQSQADPLEAVGIQLRPILRPSSTPGSENTDKSNNNDSNSSRSERVHLVEAELVGEEDPPEPVFEAQKVDEDEIECQRRRVRTLIISSVLVTLISVLVAVSLVLRFVVFKDEGDPPAAEIATAPNLTSTPSLSTTLSPTPYIGTTWVQKGQFLYGTMEEQKLATRSALSNDGSLLALPSGGNLDLGPSQGSFQMYWFDEMTQKWVPRGSRIMGKTAFDLTTDFAFSGNGAVYAARSPITSAVRVYEWDETVSDWSERQGNITARLLSISDDGSVLATVSPQTEEQTDGALIKIQIWNETETSWIPHGKAISIGEHLGQGGLHIVRSISLDPSGTRLVAAANGPLDDGSMWVDSIWAYAWNGTEWTLLASKSIDSSETAIRSVYCSFECKDIAVGYWSSSATVYTWREDDNILETKGQRLTGRNTTDDYFGIHIAISIDGSRLAVLGRRYVLAYEWLAETKNWNQMGLPLEGGNSTIAEHEKYASDFCMSGDGNTMVLVASDADFVNATHKISLAGRVEVYEWPSL